MPPATAVSAVRALATLAGQPRIGLEASGSGGVVSWRVGADEHALPRVVAALATHMSGLRHESTTGNRSVGAATSLRTSRASGLPLATTQVEPATLSVLAALAATGRDESVTLQVVLGARSTPRVVGSDVEAATRRGVQTKLSEHRFGCDIRIGAEAASTSRERMLVGGVLAGLRGLEAPGVRLHLRRASVGRFNRAGSPLLWPLWLSVTEVAALLAWPIATDAEAQLPGVPSPHPRLLPVPSRVVRKGRRLGVSAADGKAVALPTPDSLRHLHVLGPTGVGKSTLLANLALQDMAAGRSVVVIDPKGDLVEDLLARVPKRRLDDVVVLDPSGDAPVGIGVLAARNLTEADLLSEHLLGVLHSLYADAWGPRTQDILHSCLLTLARRSAQTPSDRATSLVMVPLLLTNDGFRRSVVARVAKADPMGLGTFWAWYESVSDAERQAAIAPLMNKLRPILLRPGLRAVLGQRQPKFRIEEVFTKRRILLVSLNRGSLGSEGAQLLGSLVVGLLWQAALVRAGMPQQLRHPVSVIIDEMQDYVRLPGDVADALAQARGLGVGFTLAHQHLGQLPKALREAVAANVQSQLCFQLSSSDAKAIASSRPGVLVAEDFQRLGAFQAYVRLSASGRATDWMSLTTTPLSQPLQRADVLRRQSAARYGQPLDEVEADLLGLLYAQKSTESPGATDHSQPHGPGDMPGRVRPGGAS
ncbi:MAG: type IV secretory system conjugative DNA transfer family protein [Rhodoglobus sp.]